MKKVGIGLVGSLLVGILLLSACQGPSGPPGAPGPVGPAGVSSQDVTKIIDEKFSKVDRNLPLWDIQPGTAARMRELTESFNLMWFAAQAGNWDLAGFEIYRAGEEVKATVVTRPARASMLNAWSEPNLKALGDAVKTKDRVAFERAYDNAIAGCNACHTASEGGGFSMKSVKVTRPAAPLYPNLDFKGQ
ncbi:MAG: hypothetical protein A2144_02460 [Chloroflexi bacterium RBG_16_50_9]|nr:MAG: hypothetical protein A2144_02460 [Chloroflexi bacterium RBG_16_50_9]